MTKSDETEKSDKGGSMKVYALVLVVVVLVGVIGFLLYTSYGGVLPFLTERVTNPDEAANTLSDLGNDLSGISDDLKEMENIL